MKKRAFIKYTEYGKIVPGSMIVTQGSFPSKDGRAKWYEVPMNKCCATTPSGPFNLEQFLSRMNSCYSQVTSLVPRLVYFNDGPADDGAPFTNILDGCSDMYDTANMYNTNFTQLYVDIVEDQVNASLSIPYTHTQDNGTYDCDYTNPPMNGFIADGTNYFGTGSTYVTNMYPGIFILAANNINVTEFSIAGNLGSDGYAIDAAYIVTAHPGWTAFIKTNTDVDGDPSVNHIILVYGNVSGVTQLYDNTGQYDDHCLQNLGAQNTAIITAVVATEYETPALTNEQALAIANKILDVYNDGICVPPQALRMQFTSIADLYFIADPENVNDWNSFFDLPNYGGEFTSVTVDSNWVYLYGGSNIEIIDNLFYNVDSRVLLKVIDDAGCVIGMGTSCFLYQENLNQVSFPACTYITDNGNDYGSFAYCPLLTNINLPVLQTIGLYTFVCASNGGYTYISLPELVTAGEACFYQDVFVAERVVTYNLPKLQTIDNECFYSVNTTEINLPSLTDAGFGCFRETFNTSVYNLPSCTNLGGSVGDDYVFRNIIGNTLTLTIPASRMTCDGGDPDGDIVYLQNNNTVTIITV
jgi:hypothetical protein